MNHDEAKKLVEEFRSIAADNPKIRVMADKAVKAHPHDQEVADLCARLTAAGDFRAVHVICDEIEADPDAAPGAAAQPWDPALRHTKPAATPPVPDPSPEESKIGPVPPGRGSPAPFDRSPPAGAKTSPTPAGPGAPATFDRSPPAGAKTDSGAAAQPRDPSPQHNRPGAPSDPSPQHNRPGAPWNAATQHAHHGAPSDPAPQHNRPGAPSDPAPQHNRPGAPSDPAPQHSRSGQPWNPAQPTPPSTRRDLGLAELKALAEQFRSKAGDKAAVAKLSEDTIKAHPGDRGVNDMCYAFRTADDAAAVRSTADAVKARNV